MVMARRLLGVVAASAISVTAATSYTGTAPFAYSVTWSPPLLGLNLRGADAGVAGDVFSAGRGFVRSSRAVYTFAVNTLDYKVSLRGYEEKSDEYYDARDKVHERAAKRLLRLCEKNRGFYIKAGQFIASMQQVPKQFVSTLSVLQDKVSFWSFKDMEVVFLEEFGKDVQELFASFNEQPIAAASLAQVHRAVLKDGQEVAVKVQYPGLQEQFSTDIATMAVLSKALAWLFPDYQFEWLVPEFEKGSLKELDFIQEADNAERSAKSFAHKQGVRIPRIFRELSTRRVLTMQFMEGCKVDDISSLEKAGVDPKEVAASLVDIFAEMIFCHGFVHGDPHPGNLLVYRDPSRSGKHNFDIVILDHGLYRDLDEKFRENFCRFWRALVLLDEDEILETGRNLGAGQYARYLPVIFTGRGISSKASFGQGMTPEEQKVMREEVRRFTMGDVSEWLQGLDREFLTVLRTDGLVRSIANRLGASRKERLMAYVKNAVLGLSLQHPGEPSLYEQGFIAYTRAKLDYVHLRFRLEVYELLFAAYKWYGALYRQLAQLYDKLSLGRTKTPISMIAS
ncbi:hypothetical protein M758_1G017700 [Ceratodon purpureus]|nr:hypothetical protein M758_1G017700 [Ceratodon purpureus]KAG0628314.1 hypothetical protein M758_1G017700 [Ceratodon purpureus]